ncbi:MAG TPA: DMT family transporter [Streptosporangiaceae bacterium]|nr:DMT family transporter [Streptosporangiaceae bacterium]
MIEQTTPKGGDMILAVAFALAAAFSSAVNLITQHAASISAPKRKGWRLALYLVRQPLWLLGWAAAGGVFIFQALALHNGPMSVVQPVLITELAFVLVLRRVWIRQAVAATAWASVLVVCVALAVFLIAAEPSGGHPVPDTKEWLSAVLVFGGAIVALTALGRTGTPPRRAAVFGIAAALTWAMEATFLKAATDTLTAFGIPGMLIRWPVYALIGAGIAGTVLEQAALHVGPLSVSQPMLVIINPFASIILSVWLFDERFTNSPAKIAVAAVSFLVMAAGVVMLTRTAPQDLRPSEPAEAEISLPRRPGREPRAP